MRMYRVQSATGITAVRTSRLGIIYSLSFGIMVRGLKFPYAESVMTTSTTRIKCSRLFGQEKSVLIDSLGSAEPKERRCFASTPSWKAMY